MSLFNLHQSVQGIAVTITASCFVAEFAGYWLHRLLHSDRIPFLSQGHLIHHFLIYGPGQPMRLDHYRDATDGRFSVGNVGIEWILPSALILGLCWLLMRIARVPGSYQVLALVVLLAWPIFMFSYLHDRMHLSGFWMARTPILKRWFLSARRFHDIHHHSVNAQGRMDANFGIGFYIFDAVFGTLARRHRRFNRAGFEKAKHRYGLVERDGKLVQSSDAELYFAFRK
ncbi:MAG TPA: sterol desaturase family protein [Terriglobales bacterium]|nr:sterol desaturase family protein [Terriglobales bacterium]